ncbi:hypothetical protein A2Y99_03345 [Candidatus Gottesmanbacteria bacterium RBG_13_37_7]|uniref:HTH cro/C1-type domain-containing protein n=1 Tax=Candidatus Gottesmanbacteria bacterium RBG_13_37_7 TaxID=1798369 RepID=A0A1F5YK28_9BACT|nr:MAG: hypothetical protein A2Y99_03345 [Candidatus Gottesmanbacteria bacterium RBG_13_37_7]
MRTVGEILKKARVEKGLTLEEVEKELKIRKKFLSALEENSWNKLPSLPYIKGFLKNYSSLLDLKPEEILAVFRRQFRLQEKDGLLPDGMTNPLNQPYFRFTPSVFTGLVIILFVIIFFGYLFQQYQSYTNPPILTIYSPQEGETINSDKLLLTGKTDSDAVLSIDNQKIALSENGQFSFNLTLTPGINTIIIESTSKFGKKKNITRTVQAVF